MPDAQTFKSRYGPWALVTGAARGLGMEFARQIPPLGLNLVLVDMLQDELAQVADEARQLGDVEVRTVITDLSQPDFIDAVRQQTDDIEVGLLVSNAAHTPVGLFLDTPAEDKLKMVAVNVRAALVLVQEFAPRMVARRRGGIILMSSASALTGAPYVANYAATKAYNLILAESLWYELRPHGVDVLGFMPGATRTTGFVMSKPKLERSKIAPVMHPQPTVAEALAALGKGPSRVAGRRNRWSMLLTTRLLPRRTAIAVVGRTMGRWYGKE
ncbi:MAG: short-chain dehydrogenase [Chloroflexi bacterium]|nr:MAG: short-chain dehydrogenase [Chloroflexota bacterium]